MSTTYEMVPEEFRAIVAREREDGTIRPAAESWDRAALRPGVVPIRVLCSSLNYKDALSATGHRGVSRNYPHVPGIDAAGVRLDNNDQVIVTGFDLGMGTPGGFAEYVAVPEGWIVKMPAGMTAWDAMALGTAGFTAALGVDAVQAGGVVPGAGPIVVTGASGGVGSLSVQILSKLGFEVHAVSGKSGAKDWLAEIGAAKVIGREEFLATSDRALLREEFAGAVDTLGGEYLRRILASLKFGGVAAACGMIGGAELSGTVFPFILRGVRLVGLASADTPQERKQELWNRLWSEWKIEPRGVRTVEMAELPAEIDRILAGEQMGRVVVDIGRG